jgi:hypothetical protein
MVSALYFPVLFFLVFIFMELQSFENRNLGVAVSEPTQVSMNGPVDHSWNRAFCYRLPVLYRLLQLLFHCSDSTPLFMLYSLIMYN